MNTELRHMPEVQSIAAYLRTMTFKKKLWGGCDAESVLDHFSAITLQYDAIISTCLIQNSRQAQQIAALEMKLTQQGQSGGDQSDSQHLMIQWYEETTAWLYVQCNGLQQQLMAAQAQQITQSNSTYPDWLDEGGTVYYQQNPVFSAALYK